LLPSLTDGEVDNRVAVIESTELEAGSTRVFTFGIGSSVDSALVSGKIIHILDLRV
jgi:hypothetical protein